MGEQPPPTATFDQVEDSIEQLTDRVLTGTPAPFDPGHIRPQPFPFRIGEIRRVRFSCHGVAFYQPRVTFQTAS